MIEAAMERSLSQVAFLVIESKEHLRDSSTFSSEPRRDKLIDFASVRIAVALPERNTLLVELDKRVDFPLVWFVVMPARNKLLMDLEPWLVQLMPCFLNEPSVLSETRSSKLKLPLLVPFAAIPPTALSSQVALPIAEVDWNCLNELFVWADARLDELTRQIPN